MTTYTPILKLNPVPLSSIPITTTTDAETFTTYITNLIAESIAFISEIPINNTSSNTPWQHHSEKHNVNTFVRNPRTIGDEDEYWSARHSVHELEEGGLSWEEFKHSLLENHAEHEARYIPSLKRVDRIDIPEVGVEKVFTLNGWREIRIRSYAVHHSLPFPLNPRVFPILLILAQAETDQEFVVISVPISIPPETTNTEGQTILGKTVVGRYVSVERLRVLNGDKVEWLMATASDASGNLPMAVQRRGIPATIAKDVPSFLNFVKEERSKRTT